MTISRPGVGCGPWGPPHQSSTSASLLWCALACPGRVYQGLVKKNYGQVWGCRAYPIFLQHGSEQQKFGEPIADFSLPALKGRMTSLASTGMGKKGVVAVVWSSTCSHCQRYDKYFNAFEETHPDIGLVIVSSRQGEQLESIRKA